MRATPTAFTSLSTLGVKGTACKHGQPGLSVQSINVICEANIGVHSVHTPCVQSSKVDVLQSKSPGCVTRIHPAYNSVA